MSEEMRIFFVMAHRSAGSVFGAADKPCRKDGKVLMFTEKEAEAYAKDLNDNRRSANVHYTVEIYAAG